jgi:hypothetical protein
VLKGQPGSAVLTAGGSAPASSFSSGDLFDSTSVGKSGLWFLKLSPTGIYQVLARDSRIYSSREASFSMEASSVSPAAQGDLDKQLLTSLVNWYISLPNPSRNDIDTLLVSVDNQRSDVTTSPTTLLEVIQPLITSSSVPQQIIGLAAGIRLGSPAAINITIDKISDLQSSPLFTLIEGSFHSYPRPASALPLLQQLIGLGVSGLDASVGAAIERIGGKAILPAMARLLGSGDQEAQLRAVRFFGKYTIFADAQGNMRDSGPQGPLYAAANLIYMRPAEGGASLAQCVGFWSTWWGQHRTNLGF